eukprot:CAMPEP_0175787564 /NCGR_PEP_ID=MMETSP0097-20121207/80418_1 /TAXON_ID=311494 /ORGANISM="Alexandrium monilatum, Strain CCMP3105" /LENGTH=90 /DNA_ID=CAMNT_0017098529 /DNA_START=65 /DNA_END=334 /DNA_ORIENTATION=-
MSASRVLARTSAALLPSVHTSCSPFRAWRAWSSRTGLGSSCSWSLDLGHSASMSSMSAALRSAVTTPALTMPSSVGQNPTRIAGTGTPLP